MSSKTKTPKEVQKKAKAVSSKKATNTLTLNQKTPNLLTMSDMESDVESESGSGSEEKAASKKILPPAKKLNGSTSKPSKKRHVEVESTAESDSTSESESESGSEEDDKTVSKTQSAVAAIDSSRNSQNTAATEATARKAPLPQAYKPPTGFESISTSEKKNTQASKIFSPSNLNGKQVWYITAPASVPISAVKAVSLQDVQEGKIALSHNSHDYGFVQDTNENNTHIKLLVPDDRSKSYRIDKKPINQTLHLQQIVQLPSNSTNPRALGQAPPRTAREQPEGLKMRFRPIGFGHGRTGCIGDSSEESGSDDESDVVFRAPPINKASSEDESMDDAPAIPVIKDVSKPKKKSPKRKLSDAKDRQAPKTTTAKPKSRKTKVVDAK